ncbi:MAG: TetR/AcrR family transcriptional regulator [Acidimicrobiia bacterium]
MTAPRTGPGRRRLPAAERRAQILQVAAEQFRSRGYAGCTMQDIADGTGILKATLYHYFPSKEDLLAAVLAEIHVAALEMLRQVDALEGSALARIHAYVVGHLRWTIWHPDRVEIMLHAYHHLPPAKVAEVAALRRRFSDYLTDAIDQARAVGDVDEGIDARLAANGVLGMLNWVGQWYRPGHAMSDDELVQRLAAQALRSLGAEVAGGAAGHAGEPAVRRVRSATRS